MQTRMPHDKAERIGHYFKALARYPESQAWCKEFGVPIVRAAGESTNTAGGFLVPQDFDTDISTSTRETYGAFRLGADVRPATSDWQVRPRRVAGLTANFVAENATIPESSFQLDAINADSKKLAIMARASTELFEDSAADLGAFLASEINLAFAVKEDDCAFNGDGTATYSGILGLGSALSGKKSAVTAASGHDTFAELDSVDVGSLLAGVQTSAIPGAAWYVSASGYALALCRMTDLTGGVSVIRQPDGTVEPTFLGFPVRFSASLPDVASTLVNVPMMYFGNIQMSSVLVERQPTVIALSWHRAMDQDQIMIRATRRIDIINHTLGSSTVRGPVAVLIGG